MIRIILEILFFIFLFRLVVRVILPLVLSFFVSKAAASHGSRTNNNRPTGKIKIDYMPPKPKGGVDNKVGEFVDYEEVK